MGVSFQSQFYKFIAVTILSILSAGYVELTNITQVYVKGLLNDEI